MMLKILFRNSYDLQERGKFVTDKYFEHIVVIFDIWRK